MIRYYGYLLLSIDIFGYLWLLWLFMIYLWVIIYGYSHSFMIIKIINSC